MEDSTVIDRLLFWLAFLANYGFLVTLESAAPVRTKSFTRGWKMCGLLSLLATGVVTAYAPRAWDYHLAEYRFFGFPEWNLAAQAFIGMLI